MEDNLITEFVQKGCKTKKEAAVAAQVYLELSEVKRYWEVKYHYNHVLSRLYFTAKRDKNELPDVFVPIAASESMSFNSLQSLCNGLSTQLVYIVIVNSDSTTVTYQIKDGLSNPSESSQKKNPKDNRGRYLDNKLKKHRELLEQAALYNLPITLPKSE